MRHPTSLPKATLLDTLAFARDVFFPTTAKGMFRRRRRVVALAERLDLDARAVRQLQRLHARYGAGPLLLSIPGRPFAVILDPAHARRVLAETPVPFATASMEKRAALAHFEPRNSLLSHGGARAARRRLNDVALQSDRPRHQLATDFAAVVRAQSGALLAHVASSGTLTWDVFIECWYRVVRQVVLGSGAREDHALTDMLADLRADANWAFLRPRRNALRARFFERLQAHLDRGEPGSLAGMTAAMKARDDAAPADQVAHWLFAFDEAGIALFRALALLVSHPGAAARARDEVHASAGEDAPSLPWLRACVLESVRLWPTTPLILRQTSNPVAWEHGTMAGGAGVLIFATFFNRDERRLAFAHRFAPDVWLDHLTEGTVAQWTLVPFSSGPGICPGRQIVLLLSSLMLGELLLGPSLKLVAADRLDPARPLPGTLNPFTLRFSAKA